MVLANFSSSMILMRSCRLRMASSDKGIRLPDNALFLLRSFSRNCRVLISPSKGMTASLLTRYVRATSFLPPAFLALFSLRGSLTSAFYYSSGTSVSAWVDTSSEMVMLLGGICGPSPFHSTLYVIVPTCPNGCTFFFLTASPFS
jgi:hypothetical protein